MTDWILSLAYWLHMAATVIWIGGLVFQAMILHPSLERSLEPSARARLLETIRGRSEPWAWLSLAVLVGTGLVQMSAHPLYQGLLVVRDAWSAAILAKHLTVGAMVLLAAYQTWWLYPELGRLALRQARGDVDEGAQLIRRQHRLARLALGLGLIVLALTALARTA